MTMSNLSFVWNIIIVYPHPPFFNDYGARLVVQIHFDMVKHFFGIHQAYIHVTPPIHKWTNMLCEHAQIVPHMLKLGQNIVIGPIGYISAEHVIKLDVFWSGDAHQLYPKEDLLKSDIQMSSKNWYNGACKFTLKSSIRTSLKRLCIFWEPLCTLFATFLILSSLDFTVSDVSSVERCCQKCMASVAKEQLMWAISELFWIAR